MSGERHVVLVARRSVTPYTSAWAGHHVVDLALAGVAHLRDAGAGVDEAPQDRLLADDLRVVRRVGRDRHDGESVWRYGAPPIRASSPRRWSSAATVTGSAGSPRP